MSANEKKILITGANGFVGRNLVKFLNEKKIANIQCMRDLTKKTDIIYKNISPDTDWSDILPNVSTVVHAACISHSYKVKDEDVYNINYFATKNLIDQCITFGVQSFIFISSIKVCGETTSFGEKFNKESSYKVPDCYAESKRLVELYLREEIAETNTNFMIIRSPLIFGPGVKGNFGFIEKLINCKIPIPVGNLKHNLRAIVLTDTLNEIIMFKIKNPNWMAQEVICPVDGHFSTRELIEMVARANKISPFIYSIPDWFLKLLLVFTGRRYLIPKILGNLEIQDIDELHEMINKSKCLGTMGI